MTGRRLKGPRVFGCDFAGTVVASRSSRFQPGDRVCGLVNPLRQGSCSNYLMVAAAACATIPPNVSFTLAAALPAAGTAALRALQHRPSAWWRGKAVYLHGASGGVGHLLLQLLQHQGALVTASARPERHETLRQLGAQYCVDYHSPDRVAEIGDFSVVIDCHGSLAECHTTELFRRRGGLFIPLSLKNNEIGPMLLKAFYRGPLRGLSTRLVLAIPSSRLLQNLLTWVVNGQLLPQINACLPADQAITAVTMARTGPVFGKIVVTLD